MWKGIIVSLTLAAVLAAGPAWGDTDVRSMDIEGFRLGMTTEEATKVAGGELKLTPVAVKGAPMGYTARKNELQLYFTCDELGKRLFRVQLVRMYPTRQDPIPIFESYVARYGTPDYSGRQMMSVQACWGKCFGAHPKLEFRMKIMNAADRPYPMTLTLSDEEVEAANRREFNRKKGVSASTGTAP